MRVRESTGGAEAKQAMARHDDNHTTAAGKIALRFPRGSRTDWSFLPCWCCCGLSRNKWHIASSRQRGTDG